MALKVFDYRRDVRNIVVTPEIRGRFLRMEPGQVANRHSHDLGHEMFLILSGQCEFEIEGERAILGPGQACFARRDELHQVRCVGDEPMTMYLSVTPHIDPTHTFWTADPKDGGVKERPRYAGWRSAAQDGIAIPSEPVGDIVKDHLAALRALADIVSASVRAQEVAADNVDRATHDGNREATRDALDAIWKEMYPILKATSTLSEAWNTLALKVGSELRPD